jgi:hypothetical protein
MFSSWRVTLSSNLEGVQNHMQCGYPSLCSVSSHGIIFPEKSTLLIRGCELVAKTKKKITELVYVAYWRVGPSSSDDGALYPVRSTPEPSELCKVWFSWVKSFRICGGRFRRIAIGFRTRPYNCASTTVQHVIQLSYSPVTGLQGFSGSGYQGVTISLRL